MEAREARESILSILSPLLVLALPVFADVTLKVTSSRPSIYLGESFNLTIEVNGADRGLDAPDLGVVSRPR